MAIGNSAFNSLEPNARTWRHAAHIKVENSGQSCGKAHAQRSVWVAFSRRHARSRRSICDRRLCNVLVEGTLGTRSPGSGDIATGQKKASVWPKTAISNEMRAPVREENYAQTHQRAESAGMPEVWHGDDAHSRCAGRSRPRAALICMPHVRAFRRGTRQFGCTTL